MRSLTIISHTEHYTDSHGNVVGLGATVMEINHLLNVFDTIEHVAMWHNVPAPAHCIPYGSENVVFIPIPAVGGPTAADKLKILWQTPKLLYCIKQSLRRTDYFQFRAPTGIGVFVVPYLMFLYSGKGWFKYAGDWSAAHSAITYKFQNYLLKHQARLVTINGHWPNQPKHCLSFENPCLTKQELITGQTVALEKTYSSGKINLCFVGRLESEKGVDSMIDGLFLLSEKEKAKIGQVHLVGEGRDAERYKSMVAPLDLDISFHGVLAREAVHAIYKSSHILILPSRSEGFPKVVAEAMNYGCIPIVSDIRAVKEYVTHTKTGFLLQERSPEQIRLSLGHVLNLSDYAYQNIVLAQRDVVPLFSYQHYNTQIVERIL